MSRSVHLQVSMPAGLRDEISRLATNALKEDWHLNNECVEVDRFLQDLSRGRGYYEGPQGDLVLWGTVGNWTEPKDFAQILKPFWEQLLDGKNRACHRDSSRIVILYESEQSDERGAIEIGWDDSESKDRILQLRDIGSLPFTWNT